MNKQYLSNFLSYCFGQFCFLHLPSFIRPFVIFLFTKLFRINLSTSKTKSFKSVNEMFTRQLDPHFRPWNFELDHFCSPVDGTIVDNQIIREQSFNVKNVTYNINDLIGQNLDDSFDGGDFINIYLSPKDCHRIYTPCDMQIKQVLYIPGKLLPVSPIVTRFVKHIFSTNERLVIHAEHKGVPFIMVLVGALNVGCMTIESTPGFRTNQRTLRLQQSIDIIHSSFKKGDHLATFNLGSTVLLFFPKNSFSLMSNDSPKSINYGETMTLFKNIN